MDGLYHFGNVAATHIETFQFALGITKRINGGVVIHLSLQSEAVCLIYLVFEMTEVNQCGSTGVLHLLQVATRIHRVVLKQEPVLDYLFTILYAKSLASLVIDVLDDAILVVEHHVEQGSVEHGMITHEQLRHLLLLMDLVGNVVLDAQQTDDISVFVTACHRNIRFIDTLVCRCRCIISQPNHTRLFLAFAHQDNGLAKLFIVVTVKQVGKLHRIVFLFVFPRVGKVEIVVLDHVVNPDSLLAGFQDKGQARILASVGIILPLTPTSEQAMKEWYHC